MIIFHFIRVSFKPVQIERVFYIKIICIFTYMISFLYENDKLWQKYSLKICKDSEIAKDIVQEMYIKLDKKKELNCGYVYMTLLTLFYDLKRKPKSVYLEEMEYLHPSEVQKDFERLEYFKKEFQKVPYQARECLIENQHLSYRKLAEKYKINYQYIRRMAENAKEILKENQILKGFILWLRKKGRPKKKRLGEIVEDILKVTGVKGLVEVVNGGECESCKKRKNKLNKNERLNRLFGLVQYNDVKGKATPEQIAVLKSIGVTKDSFTIREYSEEEADLIEGIYNQIHHTNVIVCRSCGGSAREWKAVFVRLQKAIDNG